MSLAVQDALRSRFEAHLALHGLSPEQVLEQVDDVFGDPLLVVATGSVLAGHGNEHSDLDLYVVVPDEVASMLPLMSYPKGARIDVLLHGAGSVTERHAQLAAGWPGPEVSPASFHRRRKSVDSLSRFGTGLVLASDGGTWAGWQRSVRADVDGWVAGWWAAEAVRKRLAARVLLAAGRSRLAALKAGEALIAALDRRAALAGESYFRWKWLGEKLRRLGDAQGLEWFRLALCPPVDPAAAHAYAARLDGLVGELLADLDTTGWQAHLEPAPGTTRHPFGGETLVTRWAMRTVAVDADSPAGTEPHWAYGLGEPWHPDVAGLFAEDLLWLGLRRPA
ncbi:MAG: hypothetical protein AVDCRST_MAG41-3203 [uncultured Corynebacteriales bacterium]|uniref:Polymerase nucleotidyl transferase domain-containing protein n=1 Tax=uncultured Mycobacteriales bacterium TaxID=581187 RepID=A0A6J4JEY3_9ACTN|nr:MAG: hypothetical protein AVDCRST_MAG41-3203 [uncultured Corynebacteriales bacterium]